MKKKDAFLIQCGEVIKEAISFHDTTQKEIAEKMHMSPQSLNSYLNGRTTWKIDDFCRIARLLNLDPNHILGFHTDREVRSELQKFFHSMSKEQKQKIIQLISYFIMQC